MFCPCKSGKEYKDCCQKFHKGILPENAEQLMRSRYSAYAFHLAPYIMDTTHPKNAHYKKDRKKWAKEILTFCQETEFKDLEILEYKEEPDFSYVTFIAHLRQKGKQASFKEKSRFEKVDGKWLYLDGEYQSL